MARTVRVTVGSIVSADDHTRTVDDRLLLADAAYRPGFGLGMQALGTSPLGG